MSTTTASTQKLAEKLGAMGLTVPQAHPPIAPLTMSQELAERVDRLGLQETNRHLRNEGFTVIKNVFTKSECEELMAALSRHSPLGASFKLVSKGEPLFFSALANERIVTVAESLLGPEMTLMQYSATMNERGIHACTH